MLGVLPGERVRRFDAGLIALIVACAPDTRTEGERLADAARADSSAAGYTVGAGANRPGVLVAGGSKASSVGVSSGGKTAQDSSASGRPTGRGSVPTTLQPVAGAVDSLGIRATQPGRRPVAVPIDTSPGGQGSRGGQGIALGPVRLLPIHEPDFLTYDSGSRSARFELAATGELPGQVSFNGSVDGTRVLEVPYGWTVVVHFENRDSEFPHSALVVVRESVIPEELPEPAFTRAATSRVHQGLLTGAATELTFVAEREGRYLLACGVFGHAQRGQWISLIVSRSTRVPSYR